MKRFAIINDPNFCAGGSEEIRVHAESCADVKRHCNSPRGRFHGVRPHFVEAETAEDAVQRELADLNADFGEGAWTRSQVKVCACCK